MARFTSQTTKARRNKRCQSRDFLALSLVLIGVAMGGILLITGSTHLRQVQEATAATKADVATRSDQDCLTGIRSVLSDEEKSSSLDVLLCSSPDLATLVRNDRSKIRHLERQKYLTQVRSYRLSGLICNNHLDPSIPPVASLPAFKCLPPEYQRRACMDGQASFPEVCSKYTHDMKLQYIPEPERNANKQDCDAPTVECNEIPMGLPGSSIAPGQLVKGVPEAKVLAMRSDGRPIWRPEALNLHLQMIQEGKDVSPLDYPGAHKALQRAADFVGINKKSVAVFGSITPWVESIVHHNGAQSPITTADYNTPVSYDERLETELMSKMLQGDKQFDVVLSYSSIEHDGQGRYGDPLDPDGDLAAMMEVWLKVTPGGWFLLHVPFVDSDVFYWYSYRGYGKARIPVLIRGWAYGGLVTSQKTYGPGESFLISQVKNESPVFILRKPDSVGADDVLDTSKFGGLVCDSSGRCSAYIVDDQK